jgi:DNA-binding transcriptional regulator YdaS (Cro superfamily)
MDAISQPSPTPAALNAAAHKLSTLEGARLKRAAAALRLTALNTASHHCGGITKLAAAIDVGQSVASNWKKRRTLIDALYCTAIEELPACPVRRWHLRPLDWHRIWPELRSAPGAPPLPKKERQ